jgi:hypothetical protein
VFHDYTLVDLVTIAILLLYGTASARGMSFRNCRRLPVSSSRTSACSTERVHDERRLLWRVGSFGPSAGARDVASSPGD